jgi:hypothetical protein
MVYEKPWMESHGAPRSAPLRDRVCRSISSGISNGPLRGCVHQGSEFENREAAWAEMTYGLLAILLGKHFRAP